MDRGADTTQFLNGNSAGVMLCNRPGEILDRSDKPSGAFVCGTVKKPWGCNVVIPEKSRVLRRLSNKDSALSRHKKWLHDLQKERELRNQRRRKEELDNDKKNKAFTDREAKLRSRALCLDEGDQREEPSSQTERDSCKYLKHDNAHTGRSSPSSTAIRQKDRNKPAWALTEAAFAEKDELDALHEHDELLSFVNDLDFEKYEHDLELQIMMRHVKERVKYLEREKHNDEARLQTVLDSEAMARKTEGISTGEIFEFEQKNTEDSDEDNEENTVRSIAANLMHEDASVRSIHSRRSIETLVAKAREKTATMESIAEADHDLPPPLIVTHKDDEGTRIAETKSLNKLPFKNRNPAV